MSPERLEEIRELLKSGYFDVHSTNRVQENIRMLMEECMFDAEIAIRLSSLANVVFRSRPADPLIYGTADNRYFLEIMDNKHVYCSFELTNEQRERWIAALNRAPKTSPVTLLEEPDELPPAG